MRYQGALFLFLRYNSDIHFRSRNWRQGSRVETTSTARAEADARQPLRLRRIDNAISWNIFFSFACTCIFHLLRHLSLWNNLENTSSLAHFRLVLRTMSEVWLSCSRTLQTIRSILSQCETRQFREDEFPGCAQTLSLVVHKDLAMTMATDALQNKISRRQ